MAKSMNLARWFAGSAVLFCTLPALAASVGRVDLDSLRTPIYSVDGTSFVRHNGDRFCNRPLYCNHLPAVVLAGDKPFVRLASGKFIDGSLMLGLIRNGKRTWFQNASDVTSSYRCGRVDWIVTDQSWGDAKFSIEVLPTATGAGLAMRIVVDHAQLGDQFIWASGGVTQTRDSALWHYDVTTVGREALLHNSFDPADCDGNSDGVTPNGWTLGDGQATRAYGHCDAASQIIATDAGAWENLTTLIHSRPTDRPLICGLVSLEKQSPIFLTITTSENKAEKPADEFTLGLRRVDAIENQVTVDTPDSWLNAAVSASCSVIDGVYRNGMYTHAGMRWSTPLIGWRVLFGGTVYGWHDNVKAEAKYCISRQITQSDKTQPQADPRYGLASQSPQSRMFGVGRINVYQPAHYDMQSQFFDQIDHAWRWTGDPDLEKLLRPSLDLHCQYLQECFDPARQGIYESYANTWPTDDQWYNGGGTSEETAYANHAEQTALLLAQRAGDKADAAIHSANLARIRTGFFNLLWDPKFGHPGSYREQGGFKRLHDNPWLYGIFCPIDAGLLDAEQAAQALYYTEWGLERIDLPYGGQQCWPSNWVPSIWSVREMWPGDNYQLALAYFQTGLAEDGWKILHGTFPQQLVFGPVPGDLGHPAGATDFNDCASTFCRTVVEGLFGYSPDYPDNVVRIAPQFPSDWNHAAINTPDCSLRFSKKDHVRSYQLTLTKPANVEMNVSVSTTLVQSVTVNGGPSKWELQPGFGRSIVKISIPNVSAADVEVTCRDEIRTAPSVVTTDSVGEVLGLAIDGWITDFHDPQGVLSGGQIHNGVLTGTIVSNVGDHLLFVLHQLGQTKEWQEVKIHVIDKSAETADAEKQMTQIPADAHWSPVDLRSVFNGDIGAIYQQKYLSPRPQTCSLRLATDGYSTWQMVLNPRNRPPQIGLENVPSMLDSHGNLVTRQGVTFAWPGEAKNIAFTSQWDNWPRHVDVPVNQKGDAVYFLLCGTTNPMEVQIANAELSLRYADGVVEKIEIIPPTNFWTMCPIDGVDYNYQRDAFCLPRVPPTTVQLGRNCRAIVLNQRLRPGIELQSVRLETLSEQVVIGLMGVSVINPDAK